MSGIYSVRADEVEFRLEQSPFHYPRVAEADQFRGFGHLAVIPYLFDYITDQGNLPSVDLIAQHLWEECDPRYVDDPAVRRRCEKLVLDFMRDLHTYALLCECWLFGQVVYKKALDVRNIDYLARLSARLAQRFPSTEPLVGVQAQMRATWGPGSDIWNPVKESRRERRQQELFERPNKLYLLTNRDRAPWKSIARVWLFGQLHVVDLAKEIMADLELASAREVAIQMRMEL